MKVLLSILALAALVTACATVKIPEATSGSKADGVISMSFQMGPYEKPVVDWEKTRLAAIERCKAWGYSNAEKFGGEKMACVNVGCDYKTITIDYQCTGSAK